MLTLMSLLLTSLCMTIRQVGTEGQQNGNLLRCREKQDVQTCSQATLSYRNKSTHSYKGCSFKKAGNKPRKPTKSSYIDAWRPIGWGGTNKSSRPDCLYSKLGIPIKTRLELFFPLSQLWLPMWKFITQIYNQATQRSRKAIDIPHTTASREVIQEG